MSKRPIQLSLLHHKERVWADYLLTYSSIKDLVKNGTVETIVQSLPQQNNHMSFAELPERVRRLLFFAKPDLIVCLDDGQKPVAPVFAIDVTEHVAARDHWIQRFPNLVACAQEGVPGAFIAPRDMPNRRGFAGKTDPFFFFAYDRVIEIHETPIYIAEWPSEDGAHLDGDSKFLDLPPHDSIGIESTINFFDLVLDAAIKGRPLSTLLRERLIVDLRQDLRRIGYQNLPKVKDFQRLSFNCPNDRPLNYSEFEKWIQAKGLALPSSLPDRITKREEWLIFSPLIRINNMESERKKLKKRIKQKGGDPYTQQPLVFDYLFCRLGPTPFERDINLVIDLTVLKFEDFAEYIKNLWTSSPLGHTDFKLIKDKIPIYTLHLREGLNQVMKNFVRIYSFTADIIVFRDGVLYF